MLDKDCDYLQNDDDAFFVPYFAVNPRKHIGEVAVFSYLPLEI